MKILGWIAINGFRESVRDKVMYSLVAFAVLLIGTSYMLGQLTAGQDVKIIKDLGLSATSVFGLFMAIFIGIGLVSKEVERRSVYSLLAKPIFRSQMIAGKYAGLALTLVELMIVTAIALFFSTFSTPMLSAALTFGLFVVGHFSDDLRHFEQVVDSPAAAALARGLYWVLPNLAQFDVRAQVVHAQPVPIGYLLWTGAYAALYIGVLLVASMAVFSRRDFK